MRIPKRSKGIPLTFNLTPMIDVVFNLIIFFLVASHFSHAEPRQEVALPSATQATEDEQPHRLVISVRADGQWSVAGTPASIDDIETMVGEGQAKSPGVFAVNIRGDRDVPYEFIEPLLLACANRGVTAVSFHVVPK
jgi:biopolymer transport protein ExbD